MKVKKFDGLLKSEMKKAVKFADPSNLFDTKATGRCTVYTEDRASGFITVKVELQSESSTARDVLMDVCLWDRRHSFAWGFGALRNVNV